MRVESTVKRWGGFLILPEYMTYQQLLAWENAINATKVKEGGKEPTTIEFYGALLPVAISLVTEWHIEKLPEIVTVENIPGSLALVGWLVESVTKLFNETNEIDPNS